MEQSARYQGYPYVNPRVTDAPSVDPATAYKWTNLPRRQLHVNNSRTNRDGQNDQQEEEIREDVEETEEQRVRPSLRKKSIELQQVVYIDVPDNDENEDSPRTEEKVPVSREDNENEGHDYVQETIFYDPFENRRIVQRSPTSPGNRSVNTPSPSRPIRPPPPTTLDINSPGSSGYSTISPGLSISSPNPGLPHFLSKESYIYGRQPTPDDGFPLSPIPVSEFPEPPPAYSEYDRVASPQPSVVVEQARPQPSEETSTPPRTQVIVQPETPLPLNMNSSRKYLHCHHCGYRVLTLVIRETGAVTHVIALSFLMLCLFPITIAIYCSKCCKYKNHYCPSCSKLIGYEVPVLCQKLVYVKE